MKGHSPEACGVVFGLGAAGFLELRAPEKRKAGASTNRILGCLCCYEVKPRLAEALQPSPVTGLMHRLEFVGRRARRLQEVSKGHKHVESVLVHKQGKTAKVLFRALRLQGAREPQPPGTFRDFLRNSWLSFRPPELPTKHPKALSRLAYFIFTAKNP